MCPGHLSEYRMRKGRVVGVDSSFHGSGLNECLWSTHSLTIPDISLLPKHCPIHLLPGVPVIRSNANLSCFTEPLEIVLPSEISPSLNIWVLTIFYIQHSTYSPLVISFLFKSCNFWKVQWYIVYLSSRRSTKCFFHEDVILGVEEILDKETGYILCLVLFWT